jgi:hypothetical protein
MSFSHTNFRHHPLKEMGFEQKSFTKLLSGRKQGHLVTALVDFAEALFMVCGRKRKEMLMVSGRKL